MHMIYNEKLLNENRITKLNYVKSRPRLILPINVGLISIMLFTAMPIAISVFPQVSKIHRNQMDIEIKDKNINYLYFNKGL